MSAKRQIADALDALPETVTVEEALDRLNRAFKRKQAPGASKIAAGAEVLQQKQEQTDRLLQLLDEERIPEARELVARMNMPHWARILAPPVVSVGNSATGQDITCQAQEARAELPRYAGQWVALRGGKVIDADQRRSELRHRLQEAGQLTGTVFMKVEG